MAQLQRALRDLWRAVRVSPAAVEAAARSARLPRPPLGPRQPRDAARQPVFGFDEWSTLQDIQGAEATRLLAEEESSANAFFADADGFMQRIQGEASQMLTLDEEDPAEVNGSFSYFQRHNSDGMVVFCREPLGGGDAEVLLDTSEVAREAGSDFADVPACKVSDDQDTHPDS